MVVLVGVGLALIQGCAEETLLFPDVFIEVRSDPLASGERIDALALVFRTPELSGFADLKPEAHRIVQKVPEGLDLATDMWVLQLKRKDVIRGKITLVVLGLVGGVPRATWVGDVDLEAPEAVPVQLRAIPSGCDGDGDGSLDCATAECCVGNEVRVADCDDSLPTVSPLVFVPKCVPCGPALDYGCDGVVETCEDGDGDGYADCDKKLDCDSERPGVHRGAVEVCDGVDNDCDTATDEGFPNFDGDELPDCVDPDDDGDGDPDDSDCAPLLASRHHDAQEQCNTIDDDCDGLTDEGLSECDSWIGDWDGDGVVGEDDCAPYDARIYSGSSHAGCCAAADVDKGPCDFDCDGAVDLCAEDDADRDGHPLATDCDDSDPRVFNGAAELCGDGVDQDCFQGDVPCEGLLDEDGDGFSPPTTEGAPGDCDDANPSVNPWAVELCNGVDDDCDGIIDGGNPGGGASCLNPHDADGLCGEIQIGLEVCAHGLEYAPSFASAQVDDATSVGVICLEYYEKESEDWCDGLDEDCDGQVDEDFTWIEKQAGPDGQPIKLAKGMSCGTGACDVPSAVVVCADDALEQPAGQSQLWCSGLEFQGVEELGGCETDACCDGIDNDCDGVVDGHTVDVTLTTCDQAGVCATALNQIGAICEAKIWKCDYSAVPDYESPEVSCDGLDNDCDGQIDELTWNGVMLGAACNGTGACGQGKVECSSVIAGATTCSTNPDGSASGAVAELCDNGKDDDCDGIVDNPTYAGAQLGEPCEGIGACGPGVVECGPDGSVTCSTNGDGSASEATAELCDGTDNDCNDIIDDGFAPEGKPCTAGEGDCSASGVFQCTPDGAASVCSVTGAPLWSSCDDGDLCTTNDHCTGGDDSACVGAPQGCDDGRVCTTDSCEGGVCIHAVADGTCLIGVCHAEGAANLSNSCLVCDPAKSKSTWSAVAAGAPCDDGNGCTIADLCDGAGGCGDAVKPCADGDECTKATCELVEGAPVCGAPVVLPGACAIGGNCYAAGAVNPINVCLICAPTEAQDAWTAQASFASCDDGDPCTNPDHCLDGACAGGLLECSDGNQCTLDVCVDGLCQYTKQDGPCEDGDACTVVDECKFGECVSGIPLVCTADGNPCTDDGCEAGLGCTYSPLLIACDDGDPCTTGDGCGSGVCAGSPLSCDDGEVCTADSCSGGECLSTPILGHTCDDGEVCTSGDACNASGTCVGTPVVCDDGNPCTNDVCVGGACSYPTNDLASCSDGTVCTTDDACSGGVCTGAALSCDDGLACTTDSCDPVTGCSNEMPTPSCVIDGACWADGESEDGNPCFVCNLSKDPTGWTQLANHAVCDDGDPCTNDDDCDKAGLCKGKKIMGCP